MSNRDAEGDPTEPESSAYGAERNLGGVVSGEAHLPDEHTRRVAAMKAKKGGADVPEPTVHTVHDETRTNVPTQVDPERERLIREEKARRSVGTGRASVTHESETEARAPARTFGPPKRPGDSAVGGHPQQHAAYQPGHHAGETPAAAHLQSHAHSAPAGDPRSHVAYRTTDSEPEHEARAPHPSQASLQSSHTAPAAEAPPSSAGELAAAGASPPTSIPPEPSSAHLAERSRRERKRERDRRAERAALRAVIFVFVGVGALGIWFVNSDLFNEPEDPNATARTASAKQVEKRPAKQRAVTTAAIDETPDLPALRLLAADGLTLAAEGIPEVNAADENNAAAISVLAAIETCRFAYAVWEFSPNKRFRFLTTCEALEGQVLVGAYEVQGSVIRMSPLTDGPATITSQLEVEKPSKMSTTVVFNSNGRTMSLMVNQRVTTMRGGLEGEAFQATYAPRNTLKVPGQRPSQPAPQGQQPQGGGLRDLLKPH